MPLTTTSFSEVKNRKYLLLTAGLVAVSAGLLIFSVLRIISIIDTSKAIRAETAKITKLKERATQVQAILNSPEYAASKGVVDTALPDKKPLLELLANLDSVGRATGVTITDLSIRPGSLATESAQRSKKNTDFDTLELTFKVTSPFDSFREFMQLIEKVAPFTTVTEFSIADRTQNQIIQATAGAQLVDVDVTTHTYYFTKPLSEKAADIKALGENERKLLAEIEQLQSVQLPAQETVVGGGRDDLFGIAGYRDLIEGQGN